MSAVQHGLKNAFTKQSIMQDPDNTGYSIEFQWEDLLSWVPLKVPVSIKATTIISATLANSIKIIIIIIITPKKT